MTRRQRSEQIDVEFRQGVAEDWAFAVSDGFRRQLDIAYLRRADTKANAALRAELGRPLKPNEQQWRMAWTRGVPPAFSFERGDTFYDPPCVRSMEWGDALKVLRRAVQILDARPDPSALSSKTASDAEAQPREQESTGGNTGSGWVRYQVTHYDAGSIVRTEEQTLSQREFAQFLRTGLCAPSRTIRLVRVRPRATPRAPGLARAAVREVRTGVRSNAGE